MTVKELIETLKTCDEKSEEKLNIGIVQYLLLKKSLIIVKNLAKLL